MPLALIAVGHIVVLKPISPNIKPFKDFNDFLPKFIDQYLAYFAFGWLASKRVLLKVTTMGTERMAFLDARIINDIYCPSTYFCGN